MTIFQAIILGIVQGITEFFPISSSGHLAILQALFGINGDVLAFDIFLHFGTLVAVVAFFWKDIIGMLTKDKMLLKFILIGSIPTFVIGFLLKDIAESFFSSPWFVGLFLTITGVFLLLASLFAIYWKRSRKERLLGCGNSIIIGIAQSLAVMPGISRSASTIGVALIAGLNEETAIKFSFLLSLPAVLAANLLKVREIYGNLVSVDMAASIAGFLAALITGFFAIKVLFGILKRGLLFLFGIYCIFIGSAVIMLSVR